MPTIAFKVTDPEKRELRSSARMKNLTVSAFIRSAVFPSKEPPKRPRIVQDKLTGLPVVRARPGAPKITSEDVREIMANFP
jgi:hypothetical protein